jgi:hypothetical protein
MFIQMLDWTGKSGTGAKKLIDMSSLWGICWPIYADLFDLINTVQPFSNFPYTVALHLKKLQNFKHLLIIFAFIEID